MAHLGAETQVSSTTSFSLEGTLQMGFFASGDDSFHTRINGERIETVIARMLGFPSEVEFEAALSGDVSADPDRPDVVRNMGRISLSVFVDDDRPVV